MSLEGCAHGPFLPGECEECEREQASEPLRHAVAEAKLERLLRARRLGAPPPLEGAMQRMIDMHVATHHGPPVAWQEWAEKVDRTFQEIVWELATDPTVIDSFAEDGRERCAYCAAATDDRRDEPHAERCLVTRARYCVAAMIWGPM